MKLKGTTILGLLLGLVAGAGLGLLLAPRPGQRTREKLGTTLAQGRSRLAGEGLGKRVADLMDSSARCVLDCLLGAKAVGLMPDERITSEVQSVLERLGLLHPDLDINTVDGVVYLRGYSNGQETMEAIQAATRETPGVREVKDETKPRAS